MLQRPAQVKSMCRKAYMSRANITKTTQKALSSNTECSRNNQSPNNKVLPAVSVLQKNSIKQKDQNLLFWLITLADLKNRILKSFLSFKCLRKVESVTELLFEDKAHTEPNTPSQRQEKNTQAIQQTSTVLQIHTRITHSFTTKGEKTQRG